MEQLFEKSPKNMVFWPRKKKGISSRVYLNKYLQNFKLKSWFFSKKKKWRHKTRKLRKIYFTWSLSVPSFKKIGEPHKKKKEKKKYKELPGRTLRFCFVLRISWELLIKLENCANLFYLIFKCAKFQKNQRTS